MTFVLCSKGAYPKKHGYPLHKKQLKQHEILLNIWKLNRRINKLLLEVLRIMQFLSHLLRRSTIFCRLSLNYLLFIRVFIMVYV